jgi:hypothetical protein
VFERIRYDHRGQQVGLSLVNGAGQTENVEIRIRKTLFRPRHESQSSAMEGTSFLAEQPKNARLIALALRFESLLKDGGAKDHAEVALWGGVTRSRISQILNLRNLAPAIQEQLLFERAGQAVPITERLLQSLTREPDWRKQVVRFEELRRDSLLGRSIQHPRPHPRQSSQTGSLT